MAGIVIHDTFFHAHLAAAGMRFVNADVLAAELALAPYEAARVADALRRALLKSGESFIFEITGAPSKIDKFTDLMRPLGLVEVSRTGVLSIERGEETL